MPEGSGVRRQKVDFQRTLRFPHPSSAIGEAENWFCAGGLPSIP
jgi:hypothetical protein